LLLVIKNKATHKVTYTSKDIKKETNSHRLTLFFVLFLEFDIANVKHQPLKNKQPQQQTLDTKIKAATPNHNIYIHKNNSATNINIEMVKHSPDRYIFQALNIMELFLVFSS
jgi:hypothetical protein